MIKDTLRFQLPRLPALIAGALRAVFTNRPLPASRPTSHFYPQQILLPSILASSALLCLPPPIPTITTTQLSEEQPDDVASFLISHLSASREAIKAAAAVK